MKSILLCCVSIFILSCQDQPQDEHMAKQQIIETLELETKYFCERNLAQWQAQWSHAAFTSKMYAGQRDFEELTGWEAINQFTVQHIEENPQAIPLPEVDLDYNIQLFTETALVFYAKRGDQGWIKETRFMVREGKQWKIARMQTIF